MANNVYIVMVVDDEQYQSIDSVWNTRDDAVQRIETELKMVAAEDEFGEWEKTLIDGCGYPYNVTAYIDERNVSVHINERKETKNGQA